MPPRREIILEDGTVAPSPAPSGRGRGKEGKDKESFGCAYPGCGQVYSRMEYLKRHQRKHQDDRPFQCRDCTKAFARSDVLLRHRRRCHPTPPASDKNDKSPPAQHRSYPGMPVSSSRNDPREASPSRRNRKHPRQDSLGNQDSSARRRVDYELSEEEDEYGDNAQYSRANGMGNGGVYGISHEVFYGGNDGPGSDPDSSTYTPHLLPLFGQPPPPPGYHNFHDQNHLEDASVLLSMAYPGGVPANETSGMTVAGQTVVPDWQAGQSINMMMESANDHDGLHTTSRPNSSSSNLDQNSRNNSNGNLNDLANGDAVLPELGNYMGTMSWLSGLSGAVLKENEAANANMGEGFNNWIASSPKPPSPFPFSSLLSPSTWGLHFPNQADNDDNANSAAVLGILDQLAMYDVPQTQFNPNPERPLIRIDKHAMRLLQGSEINNDSPFFIDSDRFIGCYQIPHWNMPPVRALSLMAHRTVNCVLPHFSFVHLPTFRLVDTPACLAFSICTVGGIKFEDDAVTEKNNQFITAEKTPPVCKQDDLDGPVPPGNTWESMYCESYNYGNGDEIIDSVKNWKSAIVVKNDKINMLVKSFALAKGVLMSEYNVGLLQALVIYHAPFFLSQEQRERQMANMFLGTIVNIARQIGFFSYEDMEHFETEIKLPVEPFTPNELTACWKKWISLETRRRTAYLIYHLDTVSALESSIPSILNSCELSMMPLPAPDTLWKASSASEWYAAAQKHQPMTLDEAMRRVFFLPTFGAFDDMHEKSDTKHYNLLNTTELGPFARVAMVLTLLRGIMDIGEGKRDRGDWRDLTDLWVSCSWLKPSKKMLASDGSDLGKVSRDGLKDRFRLGLERWRQGWDFDPTCPDGTGGRTKSNGGSTGVSPESETSPGSDSTGRGNGKLNYCEEALPFYWLAQALLNTLRTAPPHEAGYNVFHNMRYGEMLKSARTFTRLGEGVFPPTVPTGAPSTTPSSAGTSGTTATSAQVSPSSSTQSSSIHNGSVKGFTPDNSSNNHINSSVNTTNNSTSSMIDLELGGIDMNLFEELTKSVSASANINMPSSASTSTHLGGASNIDIASLIASFQPHDSIRL